MPSNRPTGPNPCRTPLAFATPRTQIYCEGTGIRTLPYFQTWTLSHACHAQCPYTLSQMYACTTSASALHCEKQSCHASPNVTMHHMCACTTSAQAFHCLTPLAFATPCTQIYCENTGIRTLPYFQTTNCDLLTKLPRDWALQLWATFWWLYLMTQLLNCELSFYLLVTVPLWLRSSIVSYLLITLPLDWAIQLWATSWLLYLLTELLWAIYCLLYLLTELSNCELPLVCSTTWLSYSSVSYLLMSYLLTVLFNCELPLDYSTSWPLDWAIQLFVTTEVSN